jgi:hypothetical protein
MLDLGLQKLGVNQICWMGWLNLSGERRIEFDIHAAHRV